jgi:hypothetical protein
VRLRIVTAVLAAALVPQPAAAEYYDRFGYSSDDVAHYKAVAQQIGSCRLAFALDDHNMDKVDVHLAPRLATLYGQCRRALEARHESVRTVRVNDTFLGMQCMAVGISGQDVHEIPACGWESRLPKPKS